MRGLIVALALIPAFASAQMPAAPSLCAASPQVAASHYPGARAIAPSNDLTRFNGKALSASGQRLVLQLRVRDTACVPIQDAVVELWQVDPFGNWRLASREDRVNPNPVFSGAGRSYTDNNGGVQFITVFPAALKREAPRVYIRIKARNMQPFVTPLFFENDARNINDAAYKRLPEAARKRVELKMSAAVTDPNSFVGSGEIILPGKVRYRTY